MLEHLEADHEVDASFSKGRIPHVADLKTPPRAPTRSEAVTIASGARSMPTTRTPRPGRSASVP